MDDSPENDVSEDVDVGALITLEQQKECCEKMVSIIISQEKIVKTRASTVDTINDVISSDDSLRASMGEYLGYHYGTLNLSLDFVENAIKNLTKFTDGEYDNLDHGARGMFINMWYNMAIAHIDTANVSVINLEQIESDMVQTLNEKTDDAQIFVKGVTYH